LVVAKFGCGSVFAIEYKRGLFDLNDRVVYGHNASCNAITVAATPAGPFQSGTSFPAPFPFAHSTANVVETFSSTARGEYSSMRTAPRSRWGMLIDRRRGPSNRRGPMTTTTPGFVPFFGTSAAPRRPELMVLAQGCESGTTNAQLVTAMKSPLDIETPERTRFRAGFYVASRDELLGGIAGAALSTWRARDRYGNYGQRNGFLEPFEIGGILIRLDNLGLTNATNVNATLSTATPGVTIIPSATRNYGTLAAGVGSGTSAPQFRFRMQPSFACGAPINFTLTVTYAGGSSPQAFNFTINTAAPTVIATTLDITAPANGTGFTAATGTQTGRLNRLSPAKFACTRKRTWVGRRNGRVPRQVYVYGPDPDVSRYR
jgi:hypothetical protein